MSYCLQTGQQMGVFVLIRWVRTKACRTCPLPAQVQSLQDVLHATQTVVLQPDKRVPNALQCPADWYPSVLHRSRSVASAFRGSKRTMVAALQLCQYANSTLTFGTPSANYRPYPDRVASTTHAAPPDMHSVRPRFSARLHTVAALVVVRHDPDALSRRRDPFPSVRASVCEPYPTCALSRYGSLSHYRFCFSNLIRISVLSAYIR